MRILFLLSAFCFLLSINGCALSRPHLREVSRETNGAVTVRDMWLTECAIWPATQNIAKQRASLGKTFAVGTSGFDQQTGGTNVVEALKYIDSIIGRLAPK